MHLHSLDAEFTVKVQQTITDCLYYGVVVIPYEGIRTPHEQARLWRKGRKTSTIKSRIRLLRKEGCNYLADVIDSVGPQHGDKITYAIPGESWHQYGEACDLYVQDIEGNPIWDSNNRGYQVLAECSTENGLTSGHYWRMKDSVHVQLRESSVKTHYTTKDINSKMEHMYNT